jgi:hypothetical protein
MQQWDSPNTLQSRNHIHHMEDDGRKLGQYSNFRNTQVQLLYVILGSDGLPPSAAAEVDMRSLFIRFVPFHPRLCLIFP